MKLGRIFKLLQEWWVLLVPLLFLLKPWEWFKTRVSRSFAENVANACYEAMTVYGTDEEILFDQLGELSASDLRNVYFAFGSRYYNSSIGIGVPNTDLLGSALDLFGWFAHELNEKEKTQMRDIWVKSDLKLTF